MDAHRLISDSGEFLEFVYGGYLNISYKRSNLFIYTYRNTNYVNFFLSNGSLGF